jgi:hypothetical protein
MNQAWKDARRVRPGLTHRGGNPGVKLTAADLAQVWLDHGGRCRYCDIRVDLMMASFDHVEPLSKGGTNYVSNLATCCITCQRTKHTKSPEEHAEYQAMVRVCPIDGTRFRPRWADVVRGFGHYCSRRCSAAMSTRERKAEVQDA